MQTRLRDVTRAFGIGEATLEDLREAANAERVDRQMADEVLRLIADWERRQYPRNELRSHVRSITPPPPPPSRHPPGESLYDAGLRGQRRRG